MANSKKKKVRVVLLRSNGSGVWIGEFISQDRNAVTITNSHKLWRWRGADGAKTTSGLAKYGPSIEYSRVEHGGTVTVFECCELHEATPLALTRAESAEWAP